MKYEETLFISDKDSETKIVRLHDLGQELVHDEIHDPFHIQLKDMSSGEILMRFDYGQDNGDDDFGLEGFSFSVSPRHNYLIVKEVQYGVSLDNLYASIYCLKNIPCSPIDEHSGINPEYISTFTSHYFLTLLFSPDEHEETLWVHGQAIDRLNTIDVYRFGGVKKGLNDDNVSLAKFHIESSYPAVKLELALRDRRFQGNLTDSQIVNSLQQVSLESDKKLCTLDCRTLLPIDSHAKMLRHSLLGSRIFKCDLTSLQAKLNSLGIQSALLSVNSKHAKPVSLLFIYTQITSSQTTNMIAIELINSLAQEYLAVYDGFECVEDIQPISWDEQPSVSFGFYAQLSCSVVEAKMTVSEFYRAFNQLTMKHQIHGVSEFFSAQQEHKIDAISLLLSQFDDYDNTDAEVIAQVQKIMLIEPRS